MREWEVAKMEDYIRFIDYRGRTPVKTEKGVRLITAKNVKLGFLQYEPQEFIQEDSYDSWMTRGIPNFGDVIFTTEAPLANVAQIDTEEKLAFAQRIIVMQPREDKLLQSFLKYMLLSPKVRDSILKKGTGATVTGIKSSLLKKVEIPIPSIEEQADIVALLDKALLSIDQAKANITENIENAKEVFQSKLNEIFSQKKEGWEESQLKDVGIIQTGTTPPTKDKSNYGHFIPFIKPAHFRLDGSLEHGESMLSESGLAKGRLFKEHSVLMVCIGATIGKTGFAPYPVSSNQQINALTPSNQHEPKLFYYALMSPFVQNQVMTIGKGAQATLPIINKTKWSNLKVRFPSDKKVQTGIVEMFDKLKQNTMALENIYQIKLSALEELKRSLLQKAFAGELTNKEVEA